jgi:hypothetical protein
MRRERSTSASTSCGHAAHRGYGREVPCMDGARGAREKNLTFSRNVRVQPCIRPLNAAKSTRSLLAWHFAGFPIDGLDRFASTSSSPLAVHETHRRNLILPLPSPFLRSRKPWPVVAAAGHQAHERESHLQMTTKLKVGQVAMQASRSCALGSAVGLRRLLQHTDEAFRRVGGGQSGATRISRFERLQT